MKQSVRRILWLVGFLLTAVLVAGLTANGWFGPSRSRADIEAVARARRSLQRGRPDQAFKLLSRVHDRSPETAQALTDTAQAILASTGDLYEHGKGTAARRLLQRSLSLKPDQPRAAKMLAAIYLASGDANPGIALLRKSAELDPTDFRPWFALGSAFREQGDFTESAQAFAQALGRSPPAAETREALAGRVGVLLDANQPELAADDLSRLNREAPDDPEALALAARLAHDQGRFDEAAELAERALAADPANRDARLVRARVRFLRRQGWLAIEDLETELASKPDDLAAVQLLALAQRSVGRDQDAAASQERANQIRDQKTRISDLTRMIQRRPDDPEPRWRMGQAALDAGMYALAFQSMQAALDIDPNCQPARDGLRRLRSEGLISRHEAGDSINEPHQGGPSAPSRPGP